MSGDMAKLQSIMSGWPTIEQEREKAAILHRLALKTSKELVTELDPYGVEEEAEEAETASEYQPEDGDAEDGDLRALPSFVSFPKLRPTSAKLGSLVDTKGGELTPNTSVGESMVSLGSFSPCSSFSELHEADLSEGKFVTHTS